MMKQTRSYDRIARKLLGTLRPPEVFCIFEGGRLLTGTQSLHLTNQARKWRLFWRLKHFY